MATCTFAVGTADDGNTPNSAASFTPAVDDLLVALVEASTTVDVAPTFVTDTGITFALAKHQVHNGGNHSGYIFVANQKVPAAAATVGTFDAPNDAANATVIYIYRVAGITRTGLGAIRSSGGNLGASGTTPNFDFSQATLTGAPTLCLFMNTSSPAGITPPTGWTEPAGGDLGTTAPAFGAATCHRDSGFAGTTVTWGSNSANAWGTLGVEIDISPYSNFLVGKFGEPLRGKI